LNLPGGGHDKSGSCALVLMIVDETLYICNLGDSRAIISQQTGTSTYSLTRDHKPSDTQELRRIIEAGGKVYQNVMNRNSSTTTNAGADNPLPCRILPGKLSVSRAFGDIEAKLTQFGGNANVLIAKPEITKIRLSAEHDFIVLGCDGIYDKLSNEEVSKVVWDTMNDESLTNFHQALGAASENILKKALLSKSFDNVTAIVLGFSNLENHFNSLRSLSTVPSRKGTANYHLSVSKSALIDRFSNSPLPIALNSNTALPVPKKLKQIANLTHLENKVSLTEARSPTNHQDEESGSGSLSPSSGNKDLIYSEASPKGGYLPMIKGVKSSSNLPGKRRFN